MLVFRDAHITPEAQTALAASLGPIMPVHPFYPSVDGHPPIAIIEDTAESKPENAEWHSDMSAMKEPPFGCILHGRVIPPVGGDTLWCSMYAVHDALPEDLRAKLKDAYAVHDIRAGYDTRLDNGKDGDRAETLENWGAEQGNEVLHKLIMPHPATGRPLIYANVSYTSRITGLEPDESRAVLKQIYELIDKPDFQVRVKWRPGTVVMWDNFATQHYAVGDHFPAHRQMNRITVARDRRAPYVAPEVVQQ